MAVTGDVKGSKATARCDGMQFRVVCAFVLLMLAGCAGAPTDMEAQPEAFQDARATSTTGAIKGVVVNDTIVPVIGATVRITPGDLEAVTDEDGAFIVNDLEPGVYFVTASAADHGEAQASVEVLAGEASDTMRIMIPYYPPPVPYVVELTTSLFMDWAVNANGNRVVLGGVTGQGSFRLDQETGANMSHIQTELVWNAAQPLTDNLRLDSSLRGADPSMTVQGTSPLVVVYESETIVPAATGMTGVLWVAPSAGTPAGLTVQQKADVFTHAFYHMVPPTGWTLGGDGPL